ncbi:hypothetical protein DS901_14195 [Loktanella sp. D2R18]|nr:hypothetical protein DS901_14195 [Loktanella sp. D2R18]
MWDARADELRARRNAFVQGMVENEYAAPNDAASAIMSPISFCKA